MVPPGDRSNRCKVPCIESQVGASPTISWVQSDGTPSAWALLTTQAQPNATRLRRSKFIIANLDA